MGALGGALADKDNIEYRKIFSNWWKSEWKTIKFPGKGTVFDYFVVKNENKLDEWSKIVKEKIYDSSVPMQQVTVPTAETVASEFFINNFINIGKPVLLAGLSGCGKTQVIKGVLGDLNPEIFMNL